MNTCDTCRYWGGELEGEKCRICEKACCYPPNDEDGFGSEQIGSLVLTGPKFSCCHWEPKELQV